MNDESLVVISRQTTLIFKLTTSVVKIWTQLLKIFFLFYLLSFIRFNCNCLMLIFSLFYSGKLTYTFVCSKIIWEIWQRKSGSLRKNSLFCRENQNQKQFFLAKQTFFLWKLAYKCKAESRHKSSRKYNFYKWMQFCKIWYLQH